MSSSKPNWNRTWVARKPCGCISEICAETFLDEALQRDWGRRGLVASLVDSEDVRLLPIRCDAHQATQAQLQEAPDA